MTVRFEDGTEKWADLLVVAEGRRSETREGLLPTVAPEYAGYVAWRGLIDERELPEDLVGCFENTFVFFEGNSRLILGYLIPGPDRVSAEGDPNG